MAAVAGGRRFEPGQGNGPGAQAAKVVTPALVEARLRMWVRPAGGATVCDGFSASADRTERGRPAERAVRLCFKWLAALRVRYAGRHTYRACYCYDSAGSGTAIASSASTGGGSRDPSEDTEREALQPLPW